MIDEYGSSLGLYLGIRKFISKSIKVSLIIKVKIFWFNKLIIIYELLSLYCLN